MNYRNALLNTQNSHLACMPRMVTMSRMVTMPVVVAIPPAPIPPLNMHGAKQISAHPPIPLTPVAGILGNQPSSKWV